jgi:hypothetical protein
MKTVWKTIPEGAHVTILSGDVAPYLEEITENTPDFVARGTINGEYCRIGMTASDPNGFILDPRPTHYAPANTITMGDLDDDT